MDRGWTDKVETMGKDQIISLRVTKEERSQIEATANKYRLSLSELMRGAVIHSRIPDPSNSLAIEAIYQANADLARLGNLLKLGIDSGTFTEARVEGLLSDIRESQKAVKAIALGLGKGDGKISNEGK